jgi:hypothetical protein
MPAQGLLKISGQHLSQKRTAKNAYLKATASQSNTYEPGIFLAAEWDA